MAGHVTPGEFRRTQNWIGRPGSVIDTASYVPPPPDRLWECLDPLEKYLHGARTLPPLLDVAAVHYQFEAIHPFLDGNGRIGRLLISLLLVEWGLLPGPVLDLSAYIEPRREQYYAGLRTVSTEGDWAGGTGSCSTASPRRRSDRSTAPIGFAICGRSSSFGSEMAEMLSRSVRTVETYRWRLQQKVGLRSRAELVRLAREAGLVQ